MNVTPKDPHSNQTSQSAPPNGDGPKNQTDRNHAGWNSWLARLCMAGIVFETVSGFAIVFSPFHAVTQWNVLLHTALGGALLLPLLYYCARHIQAYRRYGFSHVVLLGYAGLIGLALCCLSGCVVAWQALFDVRTSAFWRMAHQITTYVALAGVAPHLGVCAWKAWNNSGGRPAFRYAGASLALTLVVGAATLLAAYKYAGVRYVNEFPEDYQFVYGADRPFAPSLATTDTGNAFDVRSLAGSFSCGTAGCHEQIVEEWAPSAHRYAAMDTIFQGIQSVMAKQNGAESTRYCGGCHDPISLFSGSKNIFVDNLTSQHGFQEGVSCLSCHAIRETDVKGNANYTVTQPREYLWQWKTNGLARVARDFLIRSYPQQHNELSKRMFKKPEYCAACHKQFIDQEVNRVGWVQLQNQYDNWAVSHWNQEGDPAQTIECRECHMPLVESRDPASGDLADYNRNAEDGMHRSHRFIASNQLLPKMLDLPGWEKQVELTEQWLRGEYEIPEIRDKWAEGPIVRLTLEAPEAVTRGESIPLKVVMASNKVGHDFPTGPLDIIQSWLEVKVLDDQGQTIFASGTRDEGHFIKPGSFLFKAEPVDQFGNLIDRHNLWEMVGVRYRRALFPGHSDAVDYLIECPSTLTQGEIETEIERERESESSGSSAARELPVELPKIDQTGSYRIHVALNYRKIDQFLLNFLFGETNQITSPVTEVARAETVVRIE